MGLKFIHMKVQIKVVHIKVLTCICDTKAKAPVIGIKKSNDICGCPVCIHSGKRIRNGSRIYLDQVHCEHM